jgi:glutamate synthase domain-containing protein 1
LYLKNSAWSDRLGALFAPMLVEMTDRGPDSAGIAVYHDPAAADRHKLTVFHPDPAFDWPALVAHLGEDVEARPNDSHWVLLVSGDLRQITTEVEAFDPLLQVMSGGRVIEIYKETGLPHDVIARFGIEAMGGSHVIGHTRMAAESAVTTAGSHPFSTGPDLCLVHNGSLSNHNRLRERLARHEGLRFRTENDTEVAAAYITHRLDRGRSLHEALEDCLDDLDGFYTFVAGTAEGFAVLRDPIACKPAVIAETDEWVAMASEFRAIARLPGVAHAEIWEPEPARIYAWSRAA